ncbi:hypothetical protein Syun_015264 [Stephania yunnanensis]|uniref:OTU domain-containing protein n=1 Tax=Stephania yunnanensis TaxID=152371 RepID=A0AAP0JLC2_9MAGN
MVQAKHHHHNKSRPKKQIHVKRRGKQPDVSEFRSQLDSLGLKIVQVTADGNCFFRALADQMEGNEEEHEKYRLRVVKYIKGHREEFEPFIEDDVPFDEYCQSMEKDGTWAGNMELQAASLVTQSNICIHRVMSPRWYIRNFDDRSARMIHLSYHNEEHYNSLRMKDDPCTGPANPILIKVDADLSVTTQKPKAAISKSYGGSCGSSLDTESVKLVMSGTGCHDTAEVEQTLRQLDGDVDAAIEFLIAKREWDDGRDNENEQGTQPEKIPPAEIHENDGNASDHNNIRSSLHDKQFQNDNKKMSRNKACPCGSKKKYKDCCGSVNGKPSAEIVIGSRTHDLPKPCLLASGPSTISLEMLLWPDEFTDVRGNQRVTSGKHKKERKQSRKGRAAKVAASAGAERSLPDVGALCI